MMFKKPLSKLLLLTFTLAFLFSSVLVSAFSTGAISELFSNQKEYEFKDEFAEDKVIVKLKTNDLVARSKFPAEHKLNLGIPHKKARLINPSRQKNPQGKDTAALKQNNMFVLTLENQGKEAVLEAIKKLNADPRVEYAEPAFRIKLDEEVSISAPWYEGKWWLDNTQAPDAWNMIPENSEEVVVGILDSGIDGMHPDLFPYLWQNPGEIIDGTDTDGNGFADDLYGYDFVNKRGGIPYDIDGHGTHVAGIVIAVANPNVKIAWLGIGLGDGYVDFDAALEAINYAQNMNIMIINASWGLYSEESSLKERIENYDGLFVTSAGNKSLNNDITPQYPACYNLPNIISVAATDSNDQLALFSSYGAESVHIAAPGVGILSVAADCLVQKYLNGSWNVILDGEPPININGVWYKLMNGTSMAAPMVAGTAALVKAVHQEYSTEEAKAAILSCADALHNLKETIKTSGKLNVFCSVAGRPDVEIISILTEGPIALDINESAQLNAVILPANAQQAVIWQSSDSDTVAVSLTKGLVTAKKTGTATITASSYVNSEKTAEIIVNVTENYSGEIAFEDANFKEAVIKSLKSLPGYSQYNLESKLYSEDLEKVTYLDARYKNISSALELTYFVNLQELWIHYNQLTFLDVSNCPELLLLYCDYNRLTSLNVSNNLKLSKLSCSFNQIAEIDISNNPKLYSFTGQNNPFASSMNFTLEGNQYSVNVSGNGYFCLTYTYLMGTIVAVVRVLPAEDCEFLGWETSFLGELLDELFVAPDEWPLGGRLWAAYGGFEITASFTNFGAPTAPQNFKVMPGNEQVLLSWTVPLSSGDSEITGYEVSNNNGLTWLLAESETSHTFIGLTNGTEYTFLVRAVNADKTGSKAKATATPRTIPGKPQNFEVKIGWSGKVVLSWTASLDNGGNNIIGYQVSRDNGSNWVATTNTSYTYTGLTNGIEYIFLVRAVNDAGYGEEATITATPNIVTYIIAATVLNGSISPNGSIVVDYEGIQMFTFTPDIGYEIDRVLIDGLNDTDAAALGSYTFLNVTGNHLIEVIFKLKTYTVTFKNYDGTVLKEQTVSYGGSATAPTEGLTPPVEEGYTFTFDGWDKAFGNITENMTVTAQYISTQKTYVVQFVSDDGLIYEQTVAHGSFVIAPANPTKEGNAQYSYTFIEWDTAFDNVTGNLTVTAVFEQTVNSYTVTFKNWDGTVLKTETVQYGGSATAPIANRESDNENLYTFSKWDKAFNNVTGNLTVTAEYSQTSISIPDGDGGGLDTLTLALICGGVGTVIVILIVVAIILKKKKTIKN